MSEVMNLDKFKSPPPFTCPAVSVVIPMYNAEKFVGDCLKSLLAQTFQNFEVIIVDDCSTDSSCALVEEFYAEKFNGRLTLSHTEKNSGSGAVPRNKGLALSRGEYLFFMDADDLLTPTALEEMYMLAKNFDADVVYCEKHYKLDSVGKNIKESSGQQGNAFITEPTLESENLSERVQFILNSKYWPMPWCKLVRRKLIIEHEIFFPHCKISEDDIWTYGLLFYAEKFLRVPNVIYVYRINEESVGQKKKTPEQNIEFWLSPAFFGLGKLDDLMGKLEFFQKNLHFRYAVLEFFLASKILSPYKDTWQMPPFKIYETIKKEFGNKFGEQDVLISALFTYAMTLQKNNIINVQRFNQFADQAQKRIAQLEAEVDKDKSSSNREQLTKLQNKIDEDKSASFEPFSLDT